jgi:hypothetical protein
MVSVFHQRSQVVLQPVRFLSNSNQIQRSDSHYHRQHCRYQLERDLPQLEIEQVWNCVAQESCRQHNLPIARHNTEYRYRQVYL